ncbi:MAG: endopeptidase La [bacterium]
MEKINHRSPPQRDLRQGGMSQLPESVEVLILEDTVIFPTMTMPLVVKDEKTIKLIDHISSTPDKIVGTFTLKAANLDEHNENNFYHIGTAVKILKTLKFPDNTIRVVTQGIERIKLTSVVERTPFMKVAIKGIPDITPTPGVKLEALVRTVSNTFQKIVKLAPYLTDDLEIYVMNTSSPSHLADTIASSLNLNVKERQELLELRDPKARLEALIPILAKEENILTLGEKIRSDVQSKVGKTQREYFLREQLKVIQKELGEKDEHTADLEEIKSKIKTTKFPKEVKEKVEKEINRLSIISPASPEYSVSRTYLDWLIELPWEKETKDELDIKKAQKILDSDHYDLKDVKERIIEYLAVRKLKADSKGPILCFVGPPGVGKTSLGMSIAKALGRKFIRFSLGGVRDEAEIRGHRRTYVSALPGRIIQGIHRCGSNNPVFMLDEIDKVGSDFRGDPTAALLEALDPEQNKTFSDHYLEVPFDLSKVMFITTANIIDPILPALKDRMEILELPGYILEDKVNIAKQFLIPRQIEENGLNSKLIEITDTAVRDLIQNYTREAGVRNLERELAGCMRKVAKEVASGKKGKTILTDKSIPDLIGPHKYFFELKARTGEPGVVTGLAYTADGGTILFIEATKMKGKKEFNLTGRLGDVMKESAQAALSYVRASASKYKISPDFFNDNAFHIHVPEGATPKDGPSAGITLVMALISLLKNKPINPGIAMTGEITLRGKVLPVGGIREKVLAAKRAGIHTIILPKWNRKDVDKFTSDVRKGLRFHFVENIDEVVKIAFGEKQFKVK